MKIGGLPEAYKFGKQMVARIYEDIIANVLFRYKIKKMDDSMKLTYLICKEFGDHLTL